MSTKCDRIKGKLLIDRICLKVDCHSYCQVQCRLNEKKKCGKISQSSNSDVDCHCRPDCMQQFLNGFKQSRIDISSGRSIWSPTKEKSLFKVSNQIKKRFIVMKPEIKFNWSNNNQTIFRYVIRYPRCAKCVEYSSTKFGKFFSLASYILKTWNVCISRWTFLWMKSHFHKISLYFARLWHSECLLRVAIIYLALSYAFYFIRLNDAFKEIGQFKHKSILFVSLLRSSNTHVRMRAVHCIKYDGQKNRSRKTKLTKCMRVRVCVSAWLFSIFFSQFHVALFHLFQYFTVVNLIFEGVWPVIRYIVLKPCFNAHEICQMP